MCVGPITLPDLPTIGPVALAAEVHSLAQVVQHLQNHPGDSADPCELAQRIARLEVRARDLSTDELSRWLESLRELLEPVR
jgi:hypothetical protein